MSRIKIFILTVVITIIVGAFIPITSAFATPGDSAQDPISITTCAGLQSMAINVDTYYQLGGPINCNVAPYNTGTGFTPIGSSSSGNMFIGHLDGNGETISGLYINLPSSNDVGIFGAMGVGSTISDLSIVDADITGSYNVGIVTGGSRGQISNLDVSGTISAATAVGGITGYSYNDISSSVVDVDITASGDTIGGIVGVTSGGTYSDLEVSGTISGTFYMGGAFGNFGTGSIGHRIISSVDIFASQSVSGGLTGHMGIASIDNSFASGDITSQENGIYSNVGGFVGHAEGGTISKSYSTGSANSLGGEAGGFAGILALGSVVTDSYSRGDATGTTNVGGFVGSAQYGATNTITHVFSTGAPTGTNPANQGGLIGYSNNTTTTDSKYDRETSGTSTSAGGVGELTADMKTQSNYSGWDFDDTWMIVSGINDGYPCLQGVTPGCEFVPQVTTSVPATTVPVSNGDTFDGNGDGIADSLQSNVHSLLASSGSGRITIVSPIGTTINSVLVSPESSNVKDSAFDYKFGLVNFSVSGVTPGSTITVSMYFESNDAAQGFVARKFIDNKYSTIDGASLQSVAVGNSKALKLTYGLTDGGSLDQDGSANGVIVDPVGLGSLPGALPTTGTNTMSVVFLALTLLSAGLLFFVTNKKRRAV